MPVYAVAPLRDFWVRVYAGEGQLAAVAVRPEPFPPNHEPKITAGVYEYQYGLPEEVVNRELRISADVAHVNALSERASITIELWQTTPTRYLMPTARPAPQRRWRLRSFTAEGNFGDDGVARLSYAIDIIV
jgi:hypothetical protein